MSSFDGNKLTELSNNHDQRQRNGRKINNRFFPEKVRDITSTLMCPTHGRHSALHNFSAGKIILCYTA